MRSKSENRNKNSGAVLLLTVIIVFFATIVGLNAIIWRYNEGVDTTFVMREAKALAVAETGVWETVSYLNKLDVEWLGDSPAEHPVKITATDVGTYRTTVIDLGGTDREIQVTAYIPNASNAIITKTLHVRGRLTGQSSGGIHPIFLHAMVSCGGNGFPLIFDGAYVSGLTPNTIPKPVNNQMRGDIQSNIGLEFRNGDRKVVDGTAKTTQDEIIVENWTGDYANGQEVSVEIIPVPVLDSLTAAAYEINAEVVFHPPPGVPVLLTGQIDLGEDLVADGDIFVDGDINLDAVIKGKGYIVATGNINLTGSITGLSAGAMVNVIAFNDIIYSDPDNVVMQASMYAGNDFKILTAGKFDMSRGSLAAGQGFLISPDAEVTISWDPKLADAESNPNALGMTIGIGAGGIGGGAAFSLAGGYWKEVN